MNYKHYSPEIWKQINTTLDQVLIDDPKPIAAFDADGTLWDLDMGENFFNYQIDHKLVPLPEAPFSHYEDLKKVNNDPRAAYLWLASINNGVPLETVHAWAEKAVKDSSPVPVFTEQQKLINLFLSKGVKVYVVTASVKWAVEPAAKMFYSLEFDNVLGVATKVQNRLITQEQSGVVTYRAGKVEGLLAATNGKKPFFCSGNTMGDFELLSSATHLSLAVSAANQDDRLYRTERELLDNAKKLNWLSHRFI